MHLTYKSDDSDLQGNFPNEECAQPIQEVVINGPKPKNESIAASPASGWSGPSFLSDMASYFTGGGRNSGGGGGGIFGGGGGGSAPVDPYKKYKEELEAYNIRQGRSRYYETQGNPLDDLQGVLDVVGLVPVAGELFDGINRLLYIGRGDKINASASFSAMIPFAGIGLKYGIKGIGKKAVGEVGSDLIRVRHHTSSTGLKGIKNSGSINASRGLPYGVDVEVSPFVKNAKLGQAGTGSYIEFSVPKSLVGPPAPGYMGGTGTAGRIVTQGLPFNLTGTSPKFVRWNWLGF